MNENQPPTQCDPTRCGIVAEEIRRMALKIDELNLSVARLQAIDEGRIELLRTIERHDVRIGELEKWRAKLLGATLAAGSLGGIMATVIQHLLKL